MTARGQDTSHLKEEYTEDSQYMTARGQDTSHLKEKYTEDSQYMTARGQDTSHLKEKYTEDSQYKTARGLLSRRSQENPRTEKPRNSFDCWERPVRESCRSLGGRNFPRTAEETESTTFVKLLLAFECLCFMLMSLLYVNALCIME